MKLDINEISVIKQSIEATQFLGKDCIFVGNLLIKINKECKKYLSNTIDQPNAMRLALYCATGQKVKLLEKKSYFVDFEVGHTLGGGRFSLKEIKTFEDEATTEIKGK